MAASDDPLRVAIDVGALSGPRTGVGVLVDRLVDALETDPRVALTPYVLSMRARLAPGVRRLPLPAAAAHRLWGRFDRPRVDRWLRPAAIVHGTNYVVPPSRLPRVVSVHDCWFLAHPDEAAAPVRRAGCVLQRAVRSGAWVHAISEATADRARELLGTGRVTAIHVGPPPALAPPRPPSTPWRARLDGRPIVLALGTVERRKNLPALVDAFRRAGMTDSVLVLAGAPGDDTPALDVAIAALAPDRRADVVVTGPVDEATKSWLLHEATVLAYPSLDEGFGFPLLEAHAAGTAVVATRAGAIPEIAGDAAELVPLGDPDALAAALVDVLDDDDRRRALVAAGTANLTRFSWTGTADQLVELYHRLAAGA